MPLPPHHGPSWRPGDVPTPQISPLEGALARVRAALWPPRAAHGAALLAAAVAGLGLFGTLFQATLPARLPTELDWRAVSALLERDARPGDAVALSPMWAERAREALPERLATQPESPLVVMAYPRYTRAAEDLVGVRRVWLVSLPRAPGASGTIAADLAARAAAVDGPQRLGAIEVTRYDLRSPVLPLAWLPDRLASARVSAGGRPCAPDAGGVFRCPAPPWVHVSREVREIDYLPRPCLYAHPGSGPDAPLVIEFPDVPMGRVLRGHTGIVGEAMLVGNAPLRLAVTVDGEDVGAAVEPPRTPGWHTFQIDTTRQAGRSGTVAFTVTTDDAWQRVFCFEAMTLP